MSGAGRLLSRIEHLCGGCKKWKIQTKLCSRCFLERYCSPECQLAAWPSHKLICEPMSKEPIVIARRMRKELESHTMLQHLIRTLSLIGGPTPARDNVVVFTYIKNEKSYSCFVRYATPEEENSLREKLAKNSFLIHVLLEFLVPAEDVSFYKVSYPMECSLELCNRSYEILRGVAPVLRVPILLVINTDEINLVIDEQIVATFAKSEIVSDKQ